MRYGGSNPPLCTTTLQDLLLKLHELAIVVDRNAVDMSPAGSGRMVIALAVLGLLAIAVWQTMEPDKYRSLTWVLLGFFAFRVILGRLRSR
jgi:hypothetical protein